MASGAARSTDVVVLGLGGMGSAAAAHLARRGVRVLGVEQFGPAHALGSSHGETRIVRQAYFEHPDYVPLARRAYELWDELGAAAGRPLLHRIGGLMLGAADSQVVAGTLRSATRWSLPHERLERAAMAIRYPQFRLAEGEEAVFEAVAGWVGPEDAVRAHLAVAAAHDADLRFETVIERWELTADGVEVVVGGERVRAGRLVLAAGAWTGKVLGPVLPLRPVRRIVGYFEPRGERAAFGPDRFPVYVFDVGGGDTIYGFPETVPGRGAKVGFHYRGPDVDPDAIDRSVSATGGRGAASRAGRAHPRPRRALPRRLGVHVHDDARRALRARPPARHRRPGRRRRRLLRSRVQVHAGRRRGPRRPRHHRHHRPPRRLPPTRPVLTRSHPRSWHRILIRIR